MWKKDGFMKKFFINFLIFLVATSILLAGAGFYAYKKFLSPKVTKKTVHVEVQVLEGSVAFYEREEEGEKKFVKLVEEGETFNMEKTVEKVEDLKMLRPLIPALTGRYTGTLNMLSGKYTGAEYTYIVTEEEFYDEFLKEFERETPLKDIRVRFEQGGLSFEAMLYGMKLSGMADVVVVDPWRGLLEVRLRNMKMGAIPLEKRLLSSLEESFNEVLKRSRPKMMISDIQYGSKRLQILFKQR